MGKPTILIVDDDREVTQYLGDLFKGDGWKVFSEKDGDWALKTFKSRRIDAVVLDILIPVLNGFQVAEAIREDPRGRDIPMVIMSGIYRGAQNRQEAMEHYGLLEYMNKPVEGERLRRLLRDAVNQRQTELERGRTGSRMAITTPSGSAATTTQGAGAAVTPTPGAGSAASAYQGAGAAATTSQGAGFAVTPAPGARSAATPAFLPDGAAALMAQPLPRDPVCLRGNFSGASFPRVLQELYRIQATGALFVMREAIKKIVYLDSGLPVSVKSNLLRESLGQILVFGGQLQQHQVDDSLLAARTRRQPLGQALIAQGLLQASELEPLLGQQIELKLLDVMAWPDGEFQFKENARIPQTALRTGKSCATLILQGVTGSYSFSRVWSEIAPLLQAFPAPAADPHLRFQPIEASPELTPIMDAMDGSRTLLRLVEDGPWDREAFMATALGLYHAGVMDLYDRKLALPPLRSQESRRELAGEKNALRPEDPRIAELLASELMRLKKLDHFRALDLLREASTEAVEAAYDSLAWAVHPDMFLSAQQEVRELAEGLFNRLRTAYFVLRSPFRRESYLEQLNDATAALATDGSDLEEVQRHLQDGLEHLETGRYEQAAWHFRRAVGIDQRSAPAHARLGWCLHRASPTDHVATGEALRSLERALALDPKLDMAHLYLGHLHLAGEDQERAREHFARAVSLNPENRDAAEQLAALSVP